MPEPQTVIHNNRSCLFVKTEAGGTQTRSI